MNNRLFRVTVHYFEPGGVPIATMTVLDTIAEDDVAAREKATKAFAKSYRKENGVPAPDVRFCETKLVATVDVE